MKPGIRIIGIDDAPFRRGNKKVAIIGVVMRYNKIEDVLRSEVSVDGDDSTDSIIEMLCKKYESQGKLIMIHSITVGGLNIVDIDKVSSRLRCPVVCITRNKVNGDELKRLLARKHPSRVGLVKDMEKIDKYFVCYSGISHNEVKAIVKEIGDTPVQTAHLIARVAV
ncbi:MAG: DUF99 family protein [Candidatus Micrarchaeia archaeon]